MAGITPEASAVGAVARACEIGLRHRVPVERREVVEARDRHGALIDHGPFGAPCADVQEEIAVLATRS